MRQIITSKENNVIKSIKQLKQRKYRDRTLTFAAEGYHLLEEALKCDMQVDVVIFSEAGLKRDEAERLSLILDEKGISCYIVSDALFKTFSETESPQGVISVLHRPIFSEENTILKPSKNVLILDRLQDPGNIGAIIRTADATGYGGIIIMKGSTDVFSPKVVRAAAGSLFRVPLFFYDEPKQVLFRLGQAGKVTVAAVPDAGTDYGRIPLQRDAALMIGSEGSGLCEEFKKRAAHRVTIPMCGQIESLNASIAAAILMYERLRGGLHDE